MMQDSAIRLANPGSVRGWGEPTFTLKLIVSQDAEFSYSTPR